MSGRCSEGTRFHARSRDLLSIRSLGMEVQMPVVALSGVFPRVEKERQKDEGRISLVRGR